MAFYVGQKVVCVDNSNGFRSQHIRCPLLKGETYIVTGFAEYGSLWTTGDTSHAWSPSRFRPVIERKTDISIFTAMLNPKQREKA